MKLFRTTAPTPPEMQATILLAANRILITGILVAAVCTAIVVLL